MISTTSAPTDLPLRDEETYLGFGVYVSFDGQDVRLRAPRVFVSTTDNLVYLGPTIWRALRTWIERYPRLAAHLESN